MSLPGSIMEGLLARVAGPLSIRFVFQPLIGLLLGVRDGMVDAKAGKPPFILDLIANNENREEKLSSLLTSLSKTVLIAVMLDVIAQYLIFDQVRITSAVMIAIIILIVPYSIARAVTNRIITEMGLYGPGNQ
jgi:hypothetical protein